MDLFIVFIGFGIPLLFMFKIEWLFGFGVSFWAVLIYCILLFGISFLLLELNCCNPNVVVTLRIPIISFAIFKFFHLLFIKIYRRNPENTAGELTKKPIQDVLFSILFWLLGATMPFLLVVL